MGKKLAVFGLIMGIIVFVIGATGFVRGYSAVQQADKKADDAHKKVDTACAVLKARVIDYKNAVASESYPTLEQLQYEVNSVQKYNDDCAERTGAL